MIKRKLIVLKVFTAILSMGFIQPGNCGLVGHWPLTSINSGSTPDLSGYGTAADGTVVGGASIVTDAIRGNVLSLDGTSGYINVPNATKLNPTTLTFMAWVKVWKWNSGCAIANKATQYELENNGSSGWDAYVKVGTAFKTANSKEVWFNPEDWGWHHLAVTAGDGNVKIYYDGELINTVAATGTVPATTNALQIGAYMGGSFFKGRISDVRLYDAVLTQAQIETVIQGTRTNGPVPTAPAIGDKLVTYPKPSVETLSTNYTITVNGVNLPVVKYTHPSSGLWGGTLYSTPRTLAICHFSFVGKANIAVTVAPALPAMWTLSPLSQNIVPNISGNTLSFGVTSPQNLVLHYNGFHGISNSDGINEKLIIIADKLEDKFPVSSDTKTKNAVTGYGADNTGTRFTTAELQSCINAAAAVSGVAYIPAGVYNVDAPLIMRNNVTVYLDGGALIRPTTVKMDDCFFLFDGVSNAKILGRGMIDLHGSYWRTTYPGYDNAQFIHMINGSNNNEVEGVTYRDCANMGIWIQDSPNNLVHNIKNIDDGDFSNSGGVHSNESPYLTQNNNFVMSTDDPAVMGYEKTVHDCNYYNLRYWTRNGGLKTATYMGETNTPNTYDGTWENIDMMRSSGSTAIEAEKGTISNIYFKNIRMEYVIEAVTKISSQNEGVPGTGTVDGVHQMNITAPNFGFPFYTHSSLLAGQTGHINKNITFDNLVVAGEVVTGYSGYDWLDYDPATISNVQFTSNNNTQVEVTSSNAPYATGSGNGMLSFLRTGNTSGSTTVTFEVGGTAVMGTDYETIDTSVTFGPGVSRQDVSIVPTAQGLLNGPKSVWIMVNNAPLSTAWMVGPNYQAHVSIAAASAYTVSGTVTVSGTGLAGVTVTDGNHTATTAADGTYTLSNVPNGTYTLTPSLTGYTFTPATQSVTVSGANLTGKNFTATALVYTAPTAPILVTATPGNGQVTISFSAPFDGNSVIIDYTATSTPDGKTATITQSGSGSITITGLTNGTPYTFEVVARNAIGTSPASLASIPVTPTAAYTTVIGTAYRWYSMSGPTENTPNIVEPRLNDGNTTAAVWLIGGTSNVSEYTNAMFEGAGLTFSTPKTVTKFTFVNGAFAIGNDGAFDSGLTIQTSTDGTTWQNVTSSWALTPAYVYRSSSVSNATFTFTGAAVNIKGIRICGKINNYYAATYSWEASVNEVAAYCTTVIVTSSESVLGKDVQIYPNPATNLLNVGNLKAKSTVTVLSVDGREISKQKAVNKSAVFDVSNWKKGMYLLYIRNGNETVVKKAVIQ